jgi:beta-N-acetylhexosaminidase
VLLEANAHDPRQLSALTRGIQSLATSTGARIPVFTAINHEGGVVVRITEGVTGFPGNMAVAAAGRPQYAYLSAALAARELRAMGINMNLAPVLDVNDNPLNPVIGARSFGADPAQVAEYGRLAVRGCQDNGVIAVAKHFPGHGSVAVDSHGLLPVLDVPVERLRQRELLPFAAAIKEGVAGIMAGHIAVPALDKSGRPATLSPQILTGLLREQMGYDGLIMTDSLGMGAVSAGRGQAQAAVEAVQAGADVLLSTVPMEAHVAIIQSLVAAVRQGTISPERIDQSVLRILRVKYAYGLFEAPAPFDAGQVGSPEHQAVADEMALQAVTLVKGEAGRALLPPPPVRLLVISPDSLPPAASHDGTWFGELLRSQGYAVTELVLNLDSSVSRNQVSASAVAQAPAHDVVIWGEWELIKRYVNSDDQWQEQLIARLGKGTTPLIVVAVLIEKQLPVGHLPMPVQATPRP